MKEILHFNSTRERLNYLKGDFNENKPKEVVAPKEKQSTNKPKYCG